MRLRKGLMSVASALLLAAMPVCAFAQGGHENPFLKPYPGKYGIPPFQDITTADFLPAIKAGIAEQDQNILNIVRNRAVPDFDNTIMPLENLSPILDRVAGVFYHYNEALNTPDFAEMADQAIPLLNESRNKLYLNDQLFQRIKQVYDTRNDKGRKLTPVQKRVIEKYYRQFTEQGANLPEDKKKELVAVNDQLSKLFIQFNRNLLNSTNSFYITVYDKADLAGLPESSVNVAAEEAAKRGLPGLWVFTLHAPSRLPVLQYAQNRGLREAMYKGYTHPS